MRATSPTRGAETAYSSPNNSVGEIGEFATHLTAPAADTQSPCRVPGVRRRRRAIRIRTRRHNRTRPRRFASQFAKDLTSQSNKESEKEKIKREKNRLHRGGESHTKTRKQQVRREQGNRELELETQTQRKGTTLNNTQEEREIKHIESDTSENNEEIAE